MQRGGGSEGDVRGRDGRRNLKRETRERGNGVREEAMKKEQRDRERGREGERETTRFICREGEQSACEKATKERQQREGGRERGNKSVRKSERVRKRGNERRGKGGGE